VPGGRLTGPARIETLRLCGCQPVLRVEFTAPGQLGLPAPGGSAGS
jgi:hypothetical protein